MIVHDVTGLVLRVLLAAVLDAHERGTLTSEATPELWEHVQAILDWCSLPGDETK